MDGWMGEGREGGREVGGGTEWTDTFPSSFR